MDSGDRANHTRPARVTVGPARLLGNADGHFDADRVARRSAELERLKPFAEQIDVVDDLRALITAADKFCRERVAAP